MVFEELWEQIEELHILPNQAISQVPLVLSEDTKIRLEKLKTRDVVDIVQLAIEEVNNGSIKPLDKLIRERL